MSDTPFLPRDSNAALNGVEFENGAGVLESMPRVVYIETTNTCNLSCPMCPITMGVPSFIGKNKLFRFELIDRIRPLLEVADRCVMSGGGEPFLHPKFLDMTAIVKQAGAAVHFNTNATLMDGKSSARMIELGVDTISFSVDAADPALYSRIRVGADFNEVSRNISTLARLKREAGSEKPYLNLQMTLMKENAGEVMAVVELAAEWGVGQVVVEPLTPVFEEDATYAWFVGEHKVAAEDILPNLRMARGRARELGINFTSHYFVMGDDLPEPRLDNLKCPQPWINFGVRADGRVFPCCGTSLVMGDLSENGPVEIWNGDEYRRFRRDFSRHRAPRECALCIDEGRAMFFNADLVES